MGHSMGGATAIGAGAYSTDFVASVVLDGWFYPIEHELYPRTTQPTLLLNVADWQWPENMKRIMKLDKSYGEKVMFTFKYVFPHFDLFLGVFCFTSHMIKHLL